MASFQNQAVLSYNGQTTTSNITTGEIVEVLSATKTAVSAQYEVGGKVTYVYSIQNTGTTAFSNLSWEDDLGAYTVSGGAQEVTPLTYVEDSLCYYVNGILQPTPTIQQSSPLEVLGIQIPANGNAMLIYEATINSFAPLTKGSTITNTAVLGDATRISPVSASETIQIKEAANLTISKSLSPTTVTENGQITYTFTIQNFGNEEAGTEANVVISDMFNPILNNISVTYNGGVLPTTSYSYDQDNGQFETNPGVITVPEASFTQLDTGEWQITPGVSTLIVTGTL
ncbi:conserved repeat domain-containing protein [Lachnospiraceae bacterium XBB1006]|nr:conserved repeat domain-containing protein [Lachnospiraceae bacterium XBB1006]